MTGVNQPIDFDRPRGSPAWLISVAIHLGAVALLGFVVARTPPPPGDLTGSSAIEVNCISDEISNQRTLHVPTIAEPEAPIDAPNLLSVIPVQYTKPADESERP